MNALGYNNPKMFLETNVIDYNQGFKKLILFDILNIILNLVFFVPKVESSYFSNKRDKDQCWQLLIISQQQLENVHCQIDPLPVQDKNYSNVLSEEVSVIKTIRSLSLDFNLHDKVTQDNLRSFSSVAEDCLDIQMKCEKRIITLYGFATLASLALGSLVFYISLSLGEYVSLKDNVYDKYEDNEDLSDLMSWVYKQNDKLKKYIKDLWNTIEFDQSYTFKQMSTHNLNADESILEQDNALGSITLQNKQLLGDMLTVECAVSSLKEFNEFPELIMLKNQNSIEENRGLWITTLAYGAAAMIIPALLV